MSVALVRVRRTPTPDVVRDTSASDLDLESFARQAGVHPELVRRLVRLGLLEPRTGSNGQLTFTRRQLGELGRVERLRTGACLNYAAVGLVIDLLDRIAELESALRRTTTQPRRTTQAGGR